MKRALEELYEQKARIERELTEVAASQPSNDLEREVHEAVKEQVLEPLRGARLAILTEILRLRSP